jgi:hypothetical protein
MARLAKILCAGFFIVFLSCHKDISSHNQTGNTVSGNFSQVFDDFWQSMNTNYVFWSIDTTNWDAMHTRYAPLFSSLNLYDTNDQTKATGYFHSMLDGLTDSHFTLSIPGATIQPAHDRKLRNPQFIENLFRTAPRIPSLDGRFYYTVAVDSLFLDDKLVGIDTVSTNANFYAITGTITSNISTKHLLYFAFSKFSLVSEYMNGPESVKAVLNRFFTQLENSATDGVIIDLRGNPGGNIEDLNFFVGAFISSDLKIGDTRSKSPCGRLDYGPWEPATVKPRTGFSAFSRPIVVLVDGESVSMAEITALSLKQLPNTTLVGDTTWGAQGPLTQNPDFNDGSFSFGNLSTNIQTGETLYYGHAFTSSVMFRYIDGKIYEGLGFPPDVELKVTPDQVFLANNFVNDPQLVKAVSNIGP